MKLFRKIFKLTAAFILFPIVVIFSVYSLDQQGFFKIQKVEIRIEARASQKNYVVAKLNELQIKMDALKGISLWKAPLSQISKNLAQEKWIKKFLLSRSWPSGIILMVEPDDIALLVLPQDGTRLSSDEGSSIVPITKLGHVLDKIKSDSTPNTVVTYDVNFINNKKIREGAIGIIESLPKSGSMSASRVSEIGYDKKEGYWIKLLKSDVKVNFGEDFFEIKSARISQVLDYLESRNLKARVIDANLSKKVLVRLQSNP